jgi:hypothetical protein
MRSPITSYQSPSMSHFAVLPSSIGGDPWGAFVPSRHVRVDGIVRLAADDNSLTCVVRIRPLVSPNALPLHPYELQ